MATHRGQSLQHNFAELTVCIGLVLHFPCVSALRLAVDGRTSTKGEKVMQEEQEVELRLMTDANAAFFLVFLGLFEVKLKLREDYYIFATASWLKAGTFSIIVQVIIAVTGYILNISV